MMMRDVKKVVFETVYELKQEFDKICDTCGSFSNEAEGARIAFCTAYEIIESCGSDMEIEYQNYKHGREKMEKEIRNA